MPALSAASVLARLPSQCAVCADFGGGRVCVRCTARFGRLVARCARCAIAVPAGAGECGACLAAPPPHRHALAAVDYAPPWSTLITRFKFAAELDLAPLLAERLADAVRGSHQLRPTLLLPAPLAARRLAERGYNQARELARRVGRTLDIEADATLLLRIRETPHQTDLPPAGRAANVQGAFLVEPGRRAELRGRTVALVDDVMTSGATAAELARVLLQGGAAQVHVWVVARTPAPRGV